MNETTIVQFGVSVKEQQGYKQKENYCMCSCSIGVQSGIKYDKMSSNLFTVSLCLGEKRSIEMFYDYCGKCLTNLLNLPVRNSRSHPLPNKNFTPQAKARFMLRSVSGENCGLVVGIISGNYFLNKSDSYRPPSVK